MYRHGSRCMSFTNPNIRTSNFETQHVLYLDLDAPVYLILFVSAKLIGRQLGAVRGKLKGHPSFFEQTTRALCLGHPEAPIRVRFRPPHLPQLFWGCGGRALKVQLGHGLQNGSKPQAAHGNLLLLGSVWFKSKKQVLNCLLVIACHK